MYIYKNNVFASDQYGAPNLQDYRKKLAFIFSRSQRLGDEFIGVDFFDLLDENDDPINAYVLIFKDHLDADQFSTMCSILYRFGFEYEILPDETDSGDESNMIAIAIYN